MWTINKLILDGFVSHGHSEYTFCNGRATLVIGENLIDEGQKSNGSGKSTLIDGVAVALTGEYLRDLASKAEIVNDSYDKATIDISLTNIGDGKRMNIRRVIHKNRRSPSSVAIEVNGEVLPISGLDHGNEKILELIGVSKKDLFNYYILSKYRYKSFMNATESDRRELIGRFSNANIISGAADIIKDDCSPVDMAIEEETSDRDMLIGRRLVFEEKMSPEKLSAAKATHIASLTDVIIAKERRIAEINAEIQSIKSGFATINVDIDNHKRRIASLNESLREANAVSVDDAPSQEGYDKQMAEIDECTSCMRELLVEKEGFDMKIRELLMEKSQYDTILAGLVICPDCGANILPKSNRSAEELRTRIDEINKEVDRFMEAIKENDEIYEDLLREKAGLSKAAELTAAAIRAHSKRIMEKAEKVKTINLHIRSEEIAMANVESKRSVGAASIQSKEEMIAAISRDIDATKMDIAKADSMFSRELEKECMREITAIETQISAIDDKILKLRDKKANMIAWIELFKLFNIKLSNMAIKSIQSIANNFLARMGSDLGIMIEGYKINVDGSTNNNISLRISRGGAVEGSFGRLSGGEKARIDVSVILAMQQLINMSCPSGGLDFLGLDEISESLDGIGVDRMMRSLDGLDKTIMYITQMTEATTYDNIVKITKDMEGSHINAI